MAGPSVTVIIPCGAHHARYVTEAVASCLAADPAPDRVIVVDDGADPPVPAIPGVQIERPGHMGRSLARNYAAHLARTDWLYFLDADDLLFSNAIEQFRGCLRKEPAVVWADYAWWEPATGRAGVFHQYDFRRERLPGNNVVNIGMFVLRSRFLDVGGFDPRLDFSEERDFFSRYVANPGIRWFKHHRPFFQARVGCHAAPDARERMEEGTATINGRWYAGYYESFARR